MLDFAEKLFSGKRAFQRCTKDRVTVIVYEIRWAANSKSGFVTAKKQSLTLYTCNKLMISPKRGQPKAQFTIRKANQVPSSIRIRSKLSRHQFVKTSSFGFQSNVSLTLLRRLNSPARHLLAERGARRAASDISNFL